METLLLQLKEIGAKVTGSYARGEQTPVSDLDIYIPEEKWPAARNLLLNSSIRFESTAIGQWCSKETTPWLEVSWRFHRQRKKLKNVSVLGIDFKTW